MGQAERTGQDQQAVAPRASPGPIPLAADAGNPPPALRLPQRLSGGELALPPHLPARVPTGGWRAALTAAALSESGRGVPFLFLPVAMGAGAGLYFMAARDPPMIALVSAFVAALACALAASARHASVAGFAAALFAGAVAAGVEQRGGAVLLDQNVTTSVAGVVEAREFDAGGRVRYLVRVVATADPELTRPPGRVRLVARAPHQPLPIGAAISGRARLSAPSGPVMPGGYDYAFRAFIDGIGAHGFFYRAPESGDAGTGASASPDRLQAFGLGLRAVRERISARIRSVLAGDAGGIAAALAVSDRRGISPETVDALRATGLAHILAISGLHMALAAGTLYILIRKLLAAFPAVVEAWPVKKFAAIGALMAATAYLMISGASVSTQRAWLMLGIMLIAVLADRPALTMRNVALAAMLIILLTPSAVVGPGFQMSFAATAALIAAYAVLAARRSAGHAAPNAFAAWAPVRWLLPVAKAVIGLAITSLVAGLSTGLFSAHHFHRVAGNGVLANLLAMPLVTFVVMPAGVLALLMMPFGLDEWPLRLMGKGAGRRDRRGALCRGAGRRHRRRPDPARRHRACRQRLRHSGVSEKPSAAGRDRVDRPGRRPGAAAAEACRPGHPGERGRQPGGARRARRLGEQCRPAERVRVPAMADRARRPAACRAGHPGPRPITNSRRRSWTDCDQEGGSGSNGGPGGGQGRGQHANDGRGIRADPSHGQGERQRRSGGWE
mgnify:CR=1 FL=1|tara:strand:- start:2062 stop:4251 length:2190 start_codon:yes stop_codon:yes gene_type:complete